MDIRTFSSQGSSSGDDSDHSSHPLYVSTRNLFRVSAAFVEIIVKSRGTSCQKYKQNTRVVDSDLLNPDPDTDLDLEI
jgi:hypothetical protein